MDKPLVIKVGGSLFSHAGEIIRTILKVERQILLLPGGGIFTHAVRGTGVQGTAAHWMAIAGMEQFGWYLSTCGMETTIMPVFSDTPQILLPYQFLREHDPLPHTWEITSDTISAWFAATLFADLLILKSIDQIRAEDSPLDQITARVETDDVDPSFIPFILTHAITGEIINGTIPERIVSALQGFPVTGTRFGTII
jgi:aspartokinase-like uncharacterized kinase